MPTLTRSRPKPSTKPVAPKSKRGGAAVVIVAGVGAAGALAWWLLSRRRGGAGPPTPPPANPVVSVGNDQAVTLDATSQAQITITFSVTGSNPVNLAWTRISGPGPVNFSPLGLNQEIAGFTVPGNYLIRLTATDTTDSRAQGFDELVVTVNEAPMEAILVPGELKVDGFASYTLTRNQGDTISFVWPVTNVGSLSGAAFIQLSEGGAVVGTGAPFPIDPGMTANINFNPVVDLSSGVHILVAKVMEGLPPDGIAIGSAQIITLTVVSIPSLSAVGQPTINGIVGATLISVVRGNAIPISWAVRNAGGGSGQARLRTTSSPGTGGLQITGSLVTIPGNTTVTLLLALATGALIGGGFNYTINLRMLDGTGVVLGTWQFILSSI